MTAFGSIGRANNVTYINLHELKYSGGIDLRYSINRKNPANIRLYFGFTREPQGYTSLLKNPFKYFNIANAYSKSRLPNRRNPYGKKLV